MTQPNYTERLEIIIKQYEIERNLENYIEVNRKAVTTGINGDPIKIIKAPLNPHLSFQMGRVYLPFYIEEQGLMARGNHYGDFGSVVFIIPHDNYVVLEKILN